jgi:4-hydroxybenzoate polyprenyltransferase
MSLKDYFSLLRIGQWYKNLVIFLPIVFAGQLADSHGLMLTIIGFFALCLVSSANYIINDIKDREDDSMHPEKKYRPLATGIIGVGAAAAMSLVLLVLGLFIAVLLSAQFFLFNVALFLLSQLYTFWLRDEAFADIIVIATNFVLRAVSGAYVVIVASKPYIWVSPWLILCPFFLSLFLSAGKRRADILLLGTKAGRHKKTLELYRNIAAPIVYLSTGLLIVSYSLYSFLSVNPKLLYTLPIALYVIFRYLSLIETGSVIARHPEKAYADGRLVFGIGLWALLIYGILYL